MVPLRADKLQKKLSVVTEAYMDQIACVVDIFRTNFNPIETRSQFKTIQDTRYCLEESVYKISRSL